MTRSGKTPDGSRYVVYRPLLPAGFVARGVATAAEHPDGSSASTASPFAQMLFRGALILVIGIVLLPFSLVFRVLFSRWTVQASVGESERRWRARSRSNGGEGVKAIAEALSRGEPLDQQFPGLTPLAG